MRTLLLLAPLLFVLAGCGGCEGQISSGGPDHGHCTVFSLGL